MLVGVVAGVPWLLWQLVGWPLPDHVPSWAEVQTVLARPMDDQFLLGLLTCGAWAAWAGFTLETATATVIAVADLRAHPTPGGILAGLDRRAQHGPPLGRVTAALVSAVILALAVTRNTPTRLTLTPAAATVTATAAAPADRTDTSHRAEVPPPAPSPAASPSGWREYTVPPPHHGIHDSLWRIADRELGDPRRWTQIYRLNVGRPQPDGQRLRDPDLIYPAWILRLPTDRPTTPDRRTPAPTPPTAPAPAVAHPPTTPPTTAPAGPAGQATTSPAATSSGPAGSGQTGLVSPSRPSVPGPAATPTPLTPTGTPAGTASAAGPAVPERVPAGAQGLASTPPGAAPHTDGRDGLDLPSGGYVGLALAASVSAALAMARARRRRHDRLDGPLTFRLPLPAPAGESPPPVVQLLHRAHLAATHPTPDEHDDPDDTDPEDPDPDTDPHTTPADTRATRPSDGGPAVSLRPPAQFPPPAPAPAASGSTVPANGEATAGDRPRRTTPDGHAAAVVQVGTRHGRPVLWRPAAAGGLGLTGPGGDGVARAILAALLTAPRGAAGRRTRVLIPVTDLDRLLGHDQVPPDLPGLVPVAGVDAALDQLETQALTATRAHPGRAHPVADAGHLTVLLATPTPQTAHRLRAILTAPPGVAAVLLDAWPSGLTCHLDPAAVITAVYPAAGTSAAPILHVRADADDGHAQDVPVALPDHAEEAVGARLFHLTPADTRDILQLLTDQPTTPPADRTPPPTPPTPPDPWPTQRPVSVPATGTRSPADDAGAAGTLLTDGGGRQADLAPVPPPPVMARSWTAPVQVDVLGPPRLRVNGVETGRGVRAKSFELLALLALHPDGAAGETIGDALWPNADTDAARASLHGTLKRLRATLRGRTGAREAMFVVNASHRYRLDPRLVGSDLQAFQATCRHADTATHPQEQLAVLREAAGLYRGDLLDGAGYAWAEPARAGLHRLALQILVRLATALEDDDPEAALATLERAIALDPHNETLYQRAMRLQAALGRPEAIPATLDLLRGHLADLDVEPGPETLALARALQRPAHAPRMTGGSVVA